MTRAIILYWSNTGNTEKVAYSILNGLESAGLTVSIMKTTSADNIDYFDYDLVCIGAPSVQWHQPKQVTEFLLKKFDEYKKQDKIKSLPKNKGKKCLNLLHLFWSTHWT